MDKFLEWKRSGMPMKPLIAFSANPMKGAAPGEKSVAIESGG